MLIKSQITKTDPAATGGAPSSKPAPKNPIKQTPGKPPPKSPKLPEKHGPKKKKTDPAALHKQIREKQKEIEMLKQQQRVMAGYLSSRQTGSALMTPLKLINDENIKKESIEEQSCITSILDKIANAIEKTYPAVCEGMHMALEIDRISDAIEKEINRETLEHMRQGPKSIDELLDKMKTKEFKALIKEMQDPVVWKEMSKILERKKEASITKPSLALDILGLLWNTTHHIPKSTQPNDLKKEVMETLSQKDPEWKHRMLIKEAKERHFEKKRAPQVHSCPNGKYRIGKGPCKFNTREDATVAFLKWVKNLSKEAHSDLNTIAYELDAEHPILAKAIEAIVDEIALEYGIEKNSAEKAPLSLQDITSGAAAYNSLPTLYKNGTYIKNILRKVNIKSADIASIVEVLIKKEPGIRVTLKPNFNKTFNPTQLKSFTTGKGLLYTYDVKPRNMQDPKKSPYFEFYVEAYPEKAKAVRGKIARNIEYTDLPSSVTILLSKMKVTSGDVQKIDINQGPKGSNRVDLLRIELRQTNKSLNMQDIPAGSLKDIVDITPGKTPVIYFNQKSIDSRELKELSDIQTKKISNKKGSDYGY